MMTSIESSGKARRISRNTQGLSSWPEYLLLLSLQTLYGSRAAPHVDNRPALAELGLMLACCPPAPFTPPESRVLGLGSAVRPLEQSLPYSAAQRLLRWTFDNWSTRFPPKCSLLHSLHVCHSRTRACPPAVIAGPGDAELLCHKQGTLQPMSADSICGADCNKIFLIKLTSIIMM
jgi:hypothetical protein